MNKYIIIDQMEKQIYYCGDDIELGFILDRVVERRNRLLIPYRITYYNSGNVISIRAVVNEKLIEDYLS